MVRSVSLHDSDARRELRSRPWSRCCESRHGHVPGANSIEIAAACVLIWGLHFDGAELVHEASRDWRELWKGHVGGAGAGREEGEASVVDQPGYATRLRACYAVTDTDVLHGET